MTMIRFGNLVWLHLPRSGGTSTAAAFRALRNQLPEHEQGKWQIDDCQLGLKHDNLRIRELRIGKSIQPDVVTINIRPLSDWLYSNYKWAVAAGLQVPMERYQAGEFFSLRLGAWTPADWWLDYFGVTAETKFIRTTSLAADLDQILSPYLPASVDLFSVVPHLNGLNGSSDFSSGFATELAVTRNPRWASIESELFP